MVEVSAPDLKPLPDKLVQMITNLFLSIFIDPEIDFSFFCVTFSIALATEGKRQRI
jgi:hypothetical protein